MNPKNLISNSDQTLIGADLLHSYHQSFLAGDQTLESLLMDEEDEDDEIEQDSKPSLNPNPDPSLISPYVDPTPHMSSQFYTFNKDSHSLMVKCILEGRLATTSEIQKASPQEVLKSWRAVWKDRNEDTAYLTAWKRIQDKLQAKVDSNGSVSLYFKSNPMQSVSYVEQWQEIVSSLHADPDLLRHLGLKETIDRIKQSWTVGAKFYGIPESFIRVCVSSCGVCSGAVSSGGVRGGYCGKSKRRRFEYTESFEVPACDVQRKLQQLAVEHKVVLCIRQKYIRYKPFMAEVKDYACHRAGEPMSAAGSSSKKARVLKREPYQSKRCGCGFRIRAIVPIANYNEKDRSFVYQEEGSAMFKMYAVHTGHEPGALDGNARIIHRMVGIKGGFDADPEIYGVREDNNESEALVNHQRDDNNDTNSCQSTLLQQVQELKIETGLLVEKIAKIPVELVGPLSRELADILSRLRSVGATQNIGDALVGDNDDVVQWENALAGHDRMFAKDHQIMEEDNDFDSALGNIVTWERCKADDKWMIKGGCDSFDDKSILDCANEVEDNKLIKTVRHADEMVMGDHNSVAMHVDGFYHDNSKWYDSPIRLDDVNDSVHGGY